MPQPDAPAAALATPAGGRPPVAVVTGATSGIGFESARALTRLGFEVVVVGRDPARIRAAVDGLRALGTVPPAAPIRADLSSLAEVRAAAARIRADHPRVDRLVNCAGAIFGRREETAEGHERTWALNVLSPYLLTRELAPTLRAAGGGARVVNVASAAHRGQHLDLADPEGRARYRGWSAYGRSKLALILLTAAFARREPAEVVSYLSVHPGFVRSRFGANDRSAAGWGLRAAMLLAISPKRAARTVVAAAVDPGLGSATGSYVVRSRVAQPSRAALDTTVGDRLWELVGATTGA